MTFNFVVESFFDIFFNTNWNCSSSDESNSSIVLKGNCKRPVDDFKPENPPIGSVDVNAAALLPLLEGYKKHIQRKIIL